VGVVADIRQRGLDEDVKPMIYTAYQQERATPFLLRFVSFVARTSEPAVVAERMRAEIHRIAPDLPIAGINTMDDAVATSVAAPRFRTLLAGLFAVTAMLIATCGLYGLMAYAVTQRRREIGVRVALGATRGHVVRLVLAHALRVVVIGVVAGIVVSAGVTRVLQTFLFGVTPTEPIVFGAVTMVLFAVGLLAAWLPARRAARVDPWTALRAG
jgi:putative ABC transport system permease protein